MNEAINYEVTITTADGHVFNNGFATLYQAREFIALAARVLQPRETLTWRAL